MEKATFAAGCFWGVEKRFSETRGVLSTAVGYTGGKIENPIYEQVCSDKTGHAEAVELTFDPSIISYEGLLQIFWENHNPTTLNRQGPDIGSQYRSAVFYHTPSQQAAAEKTKEELEKSRRFAGKKIVTEIVPAQTFWRAEEYHQQYLAKRGSGFCSH